MWEGADLAGFLRAASVQPAAAARRLSHLPAPRSTAAPPRKLQTAVHRTLGAVGQYILKMLPLLVLPLLARGMLFIPRTLGLWDQAGLMSPSDTFTMFYDARPPAGSGIKAITGIGAATSKDGVHWSDQGISMTPFDTSSNSQSSSW